MLLIVSISICVANAVFDSRGVVFVCGTASFYGKTAHVEGEGGHGRTKYLSVLVAK